MFGTIISALTMAIDLVPRITKVASDVAPFIVEAKKAINLIGTSESVSDAELADVRQKIEDLEASFSSAVAERERLIAEAQKDANAG